MNVTWMKKKALSATVLLLLLTGCGTTLQTMTVYPRRLWTFATVAEDHAHQACILSCPPPTSGIGGAVTPGKITVGWSGSYDPGTSPCNCWEWSTIANRGAIEFDVHSLPAHFTTATLVLVPINVWNTQGTSASNDESGTIAGIYLPQTPWDNVLTQVTDDEHGTESAFVLAPTFPAAGDPYIVPFPSNPGSSYPPTGLPVRKHNTRYEIQVSQQIRAWQQNKEVNHGFMLVGQDESLPGKTNDSRQATYTVHLEVQYNPKQ